MAKGLSRIALIVATIAVVMLISSCSDVTESSQSSNKEKSVTSLVGEIYHGDGYFILDENGLQIVKEGAAYDENKKLWNAPFAAVRKINDTFYCDSFTSPDKFDDNMNYKGEVPQDSKKMIKLRNRVMLQKVGLPSPLQFRPLKKHSNTIGKQILPSREYHKQYTQKSH